MNRQAAWGTCFLFTVTVGCEEGSFDDRGARLEDRSPSYRLCGDSVIANGIIGVRQPGDVNDAATSVTSGTGSFCVDVRRPVSEFELCSSRGQYLARGGQTHALVNDSQTFCTAWFGGSGEPPPDALRINWRTHAAYTRYRYLVSIDTEPRNAWAQAREELNQWLARYTGGSVLDAEPIDPTQVFDEPPPMSPGLVAGMLDQALDTSWPSLLNKHLYGGEQVVTPPMMAALVIDADLGTDGIWDGLGPGGEFIRLPNTGHTLGPGSMRWAVLGFVESLVALLRSERNRTGYTDQLPLIQLLSTANRGYFGSADGQPYDIAGPAVTETSLAPYAVVSDQFELVAKFVDAVSIRSAELVADDESCYSATQSLDCGDPAMSCKLTMLLDISGCGSGELRLPFDAVDEHGNGSEPELVLIVNAGGPLLTFDPEIPSPVRGVHDFKIIAADPQGIETMSISGHPGLKCTRSDVTETTTTYDCTLDSTAELDIPNGHVLLVDATDHGGKQSHITRPFVGDNFKDGLVQAAAHMETPCRSGTCSAYTWHNAVRGKLLSSAPLREGGLCELELPDSYAGYVELVVADCLSYSVALSTDLQSASGQALSTVFAYAPTADGGLVAGGPLAINRVTIAAARKTRALYRETTNHDEQTLHTAREAAYSDWGHHIYGPIDIAHTVGTDLSDPEAVDRAPVEQKAIALYEYSANRLAAIWACLLEHPAEITTWAGTAFVDRLIDPEYRTDSLLDGLSDGAGIELADDQPFDINANTLRIRLGEAGYFALRGEALPDGTVVGDDTGLAADEWYWLFERWAGVLNPQHFGDLNPEPFDQRKPELASLNMPADESTEIKQDFDVDGRCIDDGVGITSVDVEVLDSDGNVVLDAVGVDQLPMSIEHFKHAIKIEKLFTGDFVVRITCTDAVGMQRTIKRDLIVDVDNPTCSLDLVIPEGRETRINAHGVLEVGGTVDGGYIDVSGTFSDVGTGVDRVVLTVNGGDPIAVDHDLADGTLGGRIDIPCNQTSVVTLQVFDEIERASPIRTQELRCDAHPATLVLKSNCVRQEDDIPIHLNESEDSLTYDLSSKECIDVAEIDFPFEHSKFFNRLDFLPEQGRHAEQQNLLQFDFTVDDISAAGEDGVFVFPDNIAVSRRFSIDGVVVRGWEAMESNGGEYQIPVSYQTLDKQIGTVDKDTQLLIEVRLFDGIHEQTTPYEIYLKLLHPPVFYRNCAVSQDIDECSLRTEHMGNFYTRDGESSFTRCDFIYILDLPEGSLAPVRELSVFATTTEIITSESSCEQETKIMGDTEDATDSLEDVYDCPQPRIEYSHQFSALPWDDSLNCRSGRYAPDHGRFWLSGEHEVYAAIGTELGDFDRDEQNGAFAVPEGASLMEVRTDSPRVDVYRRKPWVVGLRPEVSEYDWPLVDISNYNYKYALFQFSGRDVTENGKDGVLAENWEAIPYLCRFSITIPIPDVSASHPLYGDIEVRRDSTHGSIAHVVREE